MRSDVWRGAGVPPAAGGRCCSSPASWRGTRTLQTMTRWLQASGWHRPGGPASASNVACSEEACQRLEERLEELADRAGARVAIVGQSRGGMLARALAARRPDLVAGIVTLGSPVLSQLAVHPARARPGPARRRAGQRARPRAVLGSCLRGACCARSAATSRGASRPRSATSPSTRARTAIVDWRACLDPAAPTTSRSPPRTAAWPRPPRLPHDRRRARRVRRLRAATLPRGGASRQRTRARGPASDTTARHVERRSRQSAAARSRVHERLDAQRPKA